MALKKLLDKTLKRSEARPPSIQIDGAKITLPKSDRILYSGKVVKESETEVVLKGEDEDSYVKVLSPFRGVEKLIVFEDNQWVDSETLAALSGFDLSSILQDT
jgi:hypothetical protein